MDPFVRKRFACCPGKPMEPCTALHLTFEVRGQYALLCHHMQCVYSRLTQATSPRSAIVVFALMADGENGDRVIVTDLVQGHVAGRAK